eukprot:TRINITY_DN42141_c0_g2_i2.p1 TRINITY_DN42141_c0_g2~~TRINITY_DN42141_c0_g2_i2.p1  ORF type:complete len:490 (-),score=64.57 TRINITY_DN42141_c0_g2_i2:608-2077(-)
MALAKYAVAARLLRCGWTVLWLDFDTILYADVSQWLGKVVPSRIVLALPVTFNWLGDLHDSLLFLRPAAVDLICSVVVWLADNPVLAARTDHYLMGLLDHKTAYRSGLDDNPYATWREIVPMVPKSASLPAAWLPLDGRRAHATAAGWRGDTCMATATPAGYGPDAVVMLHLGGLSWERRTAMLEQLFSDRSGLDAEAARLLKRDFRRVPLSQQGSACSSGSRLPPRIRRKDLWVTHVTYAENCCYKSRLRNLHSAQQVAKVNATRLFTRRDLDAQFEARFAHLLDDKNAPGAGYWTWKPQVILQTLEDPAIPDETGVVVWLDAGNHYVGPLDSIIEKAVESTDVTSAVNLFTVEWRYSKPEARRLLPDGDEPYIRDMPQMGTPFIVARKTQAAIRFFREWRDLMGDYRIVSNPGDRPNILYLEKVARLTGASQEVSPLPPGRDLSTLEYQHFHIADQAVYSALFKRYGFKPITAAEQESVIVLARDMS